MPKSHQDSPEDGVREHVRIFDTTLRDGEQAPGFSMNRAQKLRMAEALGELGVDVLEAGFPAASPDDFAAVADIAEAVRDRKSVVEGRGGDGGGGGVRTSDQAV